MTEPLSFGRLLRQHRRALDLTQEELARRVGCALPTIKKFEADERRPSRALAERLARFLEIPPAEIAEFVRRARVTPAIDAHISPTLTRRDLDSLPGTTIKGYLLHERLGLGGFGAVFRATQTAVGRAVAIKVVLPQFADRPDFIRRFEAEAQIIARIEHPHIVPLYDYWREPGGAYLVMRYLRGGTLHALIQRAPLERQAAARLIEQIGGALAAAHRQDVIHRDLKPANILLDDTGNFFLADFGIAKDLAEGGELQLTQAGAVVGSPAYLAPEQLRIEPVTPQTDIYSMGLVLYEALAGAKPFAGATPAELIQQQLSAALPPLSARRPDLPPALDAVLQRATAKRPAERYPDVASLVAAVSAAWPAGDAPATLAAAAITTVLDLLDADNPYRGLRAFSEADAERFFGRDALVLRLLERLAEERADARLLAVVGPSGSGKSSVVRAGLLPALRRGGVPGSEHWFIAELVPGAHPIDEIELALLRVATAQPDNLRAQLDRDERGLLRAARLILPQDDESELLLVIDQFEELFTLTESAPERAHLLNSLVAAVTDPHSCIRVIITLRADFYDRPLLHPQLGALLQARAEVVLPLTPGELAQAISGPAQRVGLLLESGLAPLIERDVAAQPGALPLLQFALTELFARRSGRTLTLDAYQKIGGVVGALSQQAEALYDQLEPPQREAARQLFLRLITLGEGVEDTRRRVRLSELESLVSSPWSVAAEDGQSTTDNRQPTADWVINLYGRYRLLTFDHDPLTREPTVELAHEALIHAWGRLRAWLDDNRDDLRVQRRLAADADEWARAGRQVSFLASGARLAQYQALAVGGRLALSAGERAIVEASVAERERRAAAEREQQQRELTLQRRAANRLRYLVGALMLFLIAVAGLSAFALRSRGEALQNLTRSEAQRLAAEANRLLQAHGNSQLIALLSITSMQLQHTAQGYEALTGAARLDYPMHQLNGHTGKITGAVFSPNGRYILTSSWDHTARLWDAQTRNAVRVFTHPDTVENLAFSPDSAYVLTSGGDGIIRLWDTQTGQALRTFIGHAGPVSGVAFAPDQRSFLSAGTDQTVRIWDFQTGREIRRLTGHSDAVYSCIFSPDGRFIATASFDKTARLWDASTGRELQRFEGHTDWVRDVAFTMDGRHVVTASADGTARLWDAQTGAELRRFTGHNLAIEHVQVSPDNRLILTISDDHSARLWDIQTGQELRRFVGHTSEVKSGGFSPDGRFVVTGSLDGTLLLWDAQTAPILPIMIHMKDVNGVAYSPDGRMILSGSSDGTARLWDARTGIELRKLTGQEGVNRVAFSPDGRYLLTGGNDKTARLWDAQTGQELRQFVGHRTEVLGVAISPDGRYVLTSGSGEGEARLWDAQTGQELRQFVGHTFMGIWYVAFSPDGRFALTGSYDRTARLWDIATGSEVRRFTIPNDQDGVVGLAFSPDGKLVLTGNFDGNVRMWSAETGQQVRVFTGHSGVVGAVAFSPNGKSVLTGGEDGTARLWDAQTGQEIERLSGHFGDVFSVAFSPDGKRVLTGGADGTVRIWDADYHDTIKSLCGRLLRDFSDDERAQYGIPNDGPTCPKP